MKGVGSGRWAAAGEGVRSGAVGDVKFARYHYDLLSAPPFGMLL
jgi:hypothetical protein